MRKQYWLSSAAHKFAAKLALRYSGPFVIRRRRSAVIYELETKERGFVGGVHVKDLRPYVSPLNPSLPTSSKEGGQEEDAKGQAEERRTPATDRAMERSQAEEGSSSAGVRRPGAQDRSNKGRREKERTRQAEENSYKSEPGRPPRKSRATGSATVGRQRKRQRKFSSKSGTSGFSEPSTSRIFSPLGVATKPRLPLSQIRGRDVTWWTADSPLHPERASDSNERASEPREAWSRKGSNRRKGVTGEGAGLTE